jgi:hypothetical protein
MLKSRQSRYLFVLILMYGLLITLPYFFAALQSDESFVFGGFLLNPIDGNSYLAKMYQGFRGDIRFHLPFTAVQGDGTYLFLYYLFLGHISRLFQLDNISIFHIFRIINGLFLGYVFIVKLVARFPDERLRLPLAVTGLVGLGSGWLAFLVGYLPPDTWVAEAYPFLAGYANPHFPLGLGLMILLLFPGNQIHWKHILLNMILAVILAITLPFGILIVIVVWFIQACIKLVVDKNHQEFQSLILYGLSIAIASGPILVYDFWVARVHPILRGWDAQNLTPSPSFVLVIIGLLPVLVFSLVHFKARIIIEEATSRTMLVWLIASLLLLYAPIGLQRRMMTGIFIPAVWLGFYGIAQLRSERVRMNTGLLVMALSIPTTLIVLTAGIIGSKQQATEIFLWRDEIAAFTWIEENSVDNALVLTGSDTGLYIPAYTGRRVFYGHPFESVDAENQKNWVNDQMQKFAEGDILLLPKEIDLVFWGPRETNRFGSVTTDSMSVVFQNETVTIYQPRQVTK